MNHNDDQPKNRTNTLAMALVLCQTFAWVVLILDPIFSRPTDPSGMGKGLAIIFISLPAMSVVFLMNFYFIFNKALGKGYKAWGALNFLALVVVFFQANI